MLRFTYEQIVNKIKEEKGLSDRDIEIKVNEKVSQLSDLISREGAAHIVANQLGIKLSEGITSSTILKIKDIPRGMSTVNMYGKVMNINEVITFNKNGRAGRVVNFSIADETASIRVVVWEESIINEIEKNLFKVGDILKINNAYSKDNNGFIELHLGTNAQIEVNPKDSNISKVVEVGTRKLGRKNLDEINEGEFLEVYGTIVQMFEPRFFDACIKCNKKVNSENGTFICKEHGKTDSVKRMVLNFFFDDGFSNIRVVLFGDAIKGIIDYNDEDIENYSTNLFDTWRKDCLGKQVSVEGRVVKNDMFDRLELIGNKVSELNPSDLLKQNDV